LTNSIIFFNKCKLFDRFWVVDCWCFVGFEIEACFKEEILFLLIRVGLGVWGGMVGGEEGVVEGGGGFVG
jgi:hypothetical protein